MAIFRGARQDVLYVETASKRYPIYIQSGFGGAAEALAGAGLAGRRAVVVTDMNVAPLYLDAFQSAVGGVFGQLGAFVFPAGEAQKTLDTVRAMYDCFLAKRLDRKSVIIALGGGVCGDMAGFAAATFMRGVPYVQAPTTLLAQVDSSVGGKTAVDVGGVKNAVGAFYQPELALMNVDTLKTLPEEQFRSGLGEVVKHGLIGAGWYYEFLKTHSADILRMDAKALAETVAGSCRIKAAVVAADEREGGLREILNFGHTFGHAVETDSGFAIPHGQCVAIGMAAALRLSQNIAGLSEADAAKALALIGGFGLQTTYRAAHKTETAARLLQWMYADKKVKNGGITAIVLNAPGKAESRADVSEAALLAALQAALADGN